MKFSLLSYNLFYNKAYNNLDKILNSYHPHILCLQEIATNDSNFKYIEAYGYKLADFSNSFIKKGKILGVATFFKSNIFSFVESQSFDISRSVYEFMKFMVTNNFYRRTILKTQFEYKKTGKKITTYNLHLPPFATNNVRDKQIRNTFEDLQLTKKHSVIIAGDFNYPYGRKKFETMIKKYRLSEATNNIYYTLETKILKMLSVKLKLDYILYKDIKHLSTDKLDVRHSDHYPILSCFEI